FDHHVRSGHDLPEMPSFGDGGCGVVGRVWRDFETDEAVCAVAVVVHRPKDISGQLDVLDDQALDESSITDVAFSIERETESRLVVGAARNCLVKNSGVAGHP